MEDALAGIYFSDAEDWRGVWHCLCSSENHPQTQAHDFFVGQEFWVRLFGFEGFVEEVFMFPGLGVFFCTVIVDSTSHEFGHKWCQWKGSAVVDAFLSSHSRIGLCRRNLFTDPPDNARSADKIFQGKLMEDLTVAHKWRNSAPRR